VALERLYELKGRASDKPVSWLVPSVADIERYAFVGVTATVLAREYLPGPMTLVLTLRAEYLEYGAVDGTIGFRVSSDVVAQKVISEWYEEHDAPLTATSANCSGMETLATVDAIIEQFGERSSLITKVVDDGPRTGTLSMVVRVNADESVTVVRGTDEAVSRLREFLTIKGIVIR
jgi:L-threonylcarbamoyladenylate synthase